MTRITIGEILGSILSRAPVFYFVILPSVSPIVIILQHLIKVILDNFYWKNLSSFPVNRFRSRSTRLYITFSFPERAKSIPAGQELEGLMRLCQTSYRSPPTDSLPRGSV
jgi:hypothetical protein